MCGIAGLVHNQDGFSIKSNSEVSDLLNITSQKIAHRGPDAEKIKKYELLNNNVYFVHRRLAILDLSPTGTQPMSSSLGRYEIIFNGEIYNFLEIKNEIGPRRWQGSSDTEVLIEAIQIWGVEATIAKCQGMFSMAILDRQSGEFFLVRDRMGEKPLYYYLKNQVLIFASEIGAVVHWPIIDKEKNYQALEQFLAYGYISGDQSAYQSIQKLLPGTILKISLKNWDVQINTYYALSEVIKKQRSQTELLTLKEKVNFERQSLETKVNELDQLLHGVIRNQMITDVKIGSFLSGGVDSSLVTSIMQNLSSKPVNSFTVGFDFENYNEAHFADKIAKHLGTDHTELMVGKEECLSAVDQLSNIYGEPFADASQIPSILISRLTRKHVTVCLTGDGGDEVFGGYNRYELVPKMTSRLRIPNSLRWMAKSSGYKISPTHWDLITKKLQLNKKGITGDRIYKLLEHISAKNSWDFYQRLTRQWQAEEPLILKQIKKNIINEPWGQQSVFKEWYSQNWFQNLTLIEKMMFVDTISYMVDDVLVKVDRATMFNSLESRAPFLDHKILEWAWLLPIQYKVNGSHKKIILKQLLKKYIPEKLFERPKVGFSIPLEHWLRGPLKNWGDDLLSLSSMQKSGIDGWLNLDLIQKKWQAHQLGQKNHQYALWNILMLQQWLLKENKL